MRRRTFLALTAAAKAAPAVQRTGANCFNAKVGPAWMDAAAAARIGTVRLTWEKWGGRDYLLGSADDYRGLVPAHLKHLTATLDAFAARRIDVILTPLTLPGARWRQMNGGRRDGRLWKAERYVAQAQRFWQDLALSLKGQPAVYALDVLNEPHPRPDGGDVNAFHRAMLEGIRAADGTVAVVVEPAQFADPQAMSTLQPLRDERVLYSVHMYEPYEYTAWRKHRGSLRYPGKAPIAEGGPVEDISAAWLDRYFDPLRAWMRRFSVPAERILIGEFGCHRRSPGAPQYLADLIRIFDRERWHWLFYAFREDTWDGMNYEAGDGAAWSVLSKRLAT